MTDVIELDALTGEVTARAFTPAEVTQREADAAAEAARQVDADAAAVRRAALLDRLGLTEDDVRLLLGGPPGVI
jgi:hypothetical protein